MPFRTETFCRPRTHDKSRNCRFERQRYCRSRVGARCTAKRQGSPVFVGGSKGPWSRRASGHHVARRNGRRCAWAAHVRSHRQRARRGGRIGRDGLSHACLRHGDDRRGAKGATVAPTLQEIAAGRHLSTLAFSEGGSRSHFWAPVSRAKRNGAGVHITAQKSFVTSAGHAQSYVVSALSPDGTGATNSTLYLIPTGARGLSVAGPWDGLGLRANASAPMTLDDCEVGPEFQLTDDNAGFPAMLQVVLPLFNLGSAAVALGICRAAVAGTAAHLNSARFEHMGQSLGESLPTLRALLGTMQIDTDGLSARIDDVVDHLEHPRETTMLRVLESKAAAGDTAIAVTSAAMRACGGAAFAKQWPSNGCSAMLTPARSWRRLATSCVSSSARRCWGCRCSRA